MADKERALIAMSGGVDSSIAAYLMQREGFDCRGAMMKLYKPDCPKAVFNTDAEDAKAVADRIGIPFDLLNFEEEFKDKIIEKFIRVYEEGGTPNPCVDCNRYIKFSKMLEFAAEKDCNYIVTGHYARIKKDPDSGRYILKKAVDLTKDQSYVLYNLTQEELAHIKLPLGEMTKDEARKLAEENGFVNAHKKDSQDICFVPDGDYVSFIESYKGKIYKEGNFIDKDGNILGRHKGAIHYTKGQRKGLGIAAGHPIYVSSKNMTDNTVTVGEEEDLFADSCIVEDLNWIAFDELKSELRCKVKLRYRQAEKDCTLLPQENGRVKVLLDEAQRAITAGQAAVFYDGENVIGGGTIVE